MTKLKSNFWYFNGIVQCIPRARDINLKPSRVDRVRSISGLRGGRQHGPGQVCVPGVHPLRGFRLDWHGNKRRWLKACLRLQNSKQTWRTATWCPWPSWGACRTCSLWRFVQLTQNLLVVSRGVGGSKDHICVTSKAKEAAGLLWLWGRVRGLVCTFPVVTWFHSGHN
jgi:hypothetical protein